MICWFIFLAAMIGFTVYHIDRDRESFLLGLSVTLIYVGGSGILALLNYVQLGRVLL